MVAEGGKSDLQKIFSLTKTYFRSLGLSESVDKSWVDVVRILSALEGISSKVRTGTVTT